jgi:ubiquinone/menaquinone biosynthesis C-methylase UbiE
MNEQVELGENDGSFEAEIYREVRSETFGEDLGQLSWSTAAECDEFCRWLRLGAHQRILEVGCGSGGAGVRMAERFGASVVGIDIDETALRSASTRARARGVNDRVEFRPTDADVALPFPEESFDGIFCHDAINHLRDRRRALADWYRLLRRGGRCFYTDPVVVTGCISNAEVKTRSSIGFFLLTPQGANEETLRQVGFRVVLTADMTGSLSQSSQRWHRAREKRRNALCRLEGEAKFQELQDFLAIVHLLAREQRLSRFAYVAEK